MIENVPLYPLAPLLLAAVVLFALLMARHLRVFAYARGPANVGDEPGRLASLIRYAIVQVRMFRDLDAGLLHAAIFWGFVISTIGTADRVTFGLVHTIVRPLLEGWLWRLLILGQNIFILVVLAAIAYALFRRLVWRYPRRVTLSRDGVVILLLIGAVVVSEWFAEAFRIAAYGDPDAAWAIAAYPLSIALVGILPASWLPVGYGIFFWANVALVSFFLVYLPRSKHLHIVTAFSTQPCASSSRAASCRRSTSRPTTPTPDSGIKTIDDMSWKDLLDGFTCTECGRCQEACPAWATGKPLNPKTMIMGIREMAVESEHGVSLIPWIRPSDPPGGQATPVVDTAILVRRSLGLRDLWRLRGSVPGDDRARRQDRRPPAQPRPGGVAISGRADRVVQQPRAPLNIWGQPQASRLDWARGLPFEVPTAVSVVESGGPDAVAELECLYWVGCAASFDDRNRRVARAVVDMSGGRRPVRGTRPGRVVHRRSSPTDGQRLRLPAAGGCER